MDKVLVVSTIPPFVMRQDDKRYWQHWLMNMDAYRAPGYDTDVLAVLETDAREMRPFDDLLTEFYLLRQAGWNCDWQTFSIVNHDVEYNSQSRLTRICTGRNLATQHAADNGYSHILYMDADIMPAPSLVSSLLAVDYEIVGANVPTYALDGPKVNLPAAEMRNWDIRTHMNTAGCLLVKRSLFSRLRWRYDLTAGMTDDPCFYADAMLLGFPTYVRHDVICRHFPEQIPPMENRGHDRKIR